MGPVTSLIFFLLQVKKKKEKRKDSLKEIKMHSVQVGGLMEKKSSKMLSSIKERCLWWVNASVGVGRPVTWLKLFVIRGLQAPQVCRAAGLNQRG